MDAAIVSVIVTMAVVTIIVLSLRVLYCHRLFKSLKGLRKKIQTQHEQLMNGIESLKGYNSGLYETSTRPSAEHHYASATKSTGEHQYESTSQPTAEHQYESTSRPMAEQQFQYSSLAIESGDPYQIIPADEKKIKM